MTKPSTTLLHAHISLAVTEKRIYLCDDDVSERTHNILADATTKAFKDAGIDIHHETRTREDLITAIAHLEHLAGCLRDEIADGAYCD